MPLAETQEGIDERLGDGASLAEIEAEIIDPAPLSEDQRAALWLYASATLPGHLTEVVAEKAKRPRLGRISTLLPGLRSAGSTVARVLRKTRRENDRSATARERVDLQREATEARPGMVKSEGAWRRLERFKQGEIDRWGRKATAHTPLSDFYIEQR